MHATLTDEQSRGAWTYRAVRPLPVPATWTPGQRVVADCSWGVKLLCRWANAPDPMGGPIGNSATIAAHLPHLYLTTELQVGDPVTFGRWGTEHAAMVMEPGRDPLLWSMGHQGAPNAYRLSWDSREHQLLRLMPPDPKPVTPQDLLRAKTGYWSWLQWKLGEGAWEKYPPEAPNVRPDVPTHIGLPTNGTGQWWIRLQLFAANRNRPNKATAPVKEPK
jgi:hypothetical protein